MVKDFLELVLKSIVPEEFSDIQVTGNEREASAFLPQGLWNILVCRVAEISSIRNSDISNEFSPVSRSYLLSMVSDSGTYFVKLSLKKKSDVLITMKVLAKEVVQDGNIIVEGV